MHDTHTTLSRIARISRLFPLLFLLVWVRLFYWQVIKGPELQARSERQHQTSVVIQADRGQIFDRHGSLLAGTEPVYHLYVYRPELKMSTSELVDQLIPILASESTDSSPIRQYLTDRLSLTSNWISLQHNLKTATKDAIAGLRIKGVGFENSHARYYPESSMSAHILGFVGKNKAGESQGYFGLEGYFDRSLKGRSGRVRAEKDAMGNQILVGGYTHYQAMVGQDIHTTIDKKLQYLSEQSLLAGLEQYQAESGTIIIMDSNTAQVMAMVSLPDYHPGNFSEFPARYHKNPSIANLFEPGSIFKPLVMASALNENAIDIDTLCDSCRGPVNIGQYSIKTWDDKYHPDSSMFDILSNSDNTGMVFIARKLGGNRMSSYFQMLGLGKKTGIELQEEVTSTLKTGDSLREIDIATQSFGQGIAITPIQMISAFNTLANKGHYLPARITPDQAVKPSKVFDPETISDITSLMVQSIDKHGDKWGKPKNLSVAGKTGTAQIAVSGGYDETQTIASFVGFFPADKPRYTMLVILDRPQFSRWGSETAAPLWFSLMKQIMM
jgi:cell division protein FtsI/penicillin-binding protein 2